MATGGAAQFKTLFDVYVEGVVIGTKTFTANDDLHIWDGIGTQEFLKFRSTAMQEYTGVGYALEVSAIENKTGLPDRRVGVSLGIGRDNASAKALLSQDLGPVKALLRFAISQDGGKTFVLLPSIRKGQLSNIQFDSQRGTMNTELETLRGDILRAVPRYWSHETQQLRHPGDKGLEFLSQMQEGFESTFPFGFEPELSVRKTERGAGSDPNASGPPTGGFSFWSPR